MAIPRRLDAFCALVVPSEENAQTAASLAQLCEAVAERDRVDDEMTVRVITREDLEQSNQSRKGAEGLAESLERRVREDMRKCLPLLNGSRLPDQESAKYSFILVGFPANLEETKAILNRDGALLESVMLLSGSVEPAPIIPDFAAQVSVCQTWREVRDREECEPCMGGKQPSGKSNTTDVNVFHTLLAEHDAGKPGFRDITFARIGGVTNRGFARPGEELKKEVLPLLRYQSAQKKNYQDWLGNLKVTPLPEKTELDLSSLVESATNAMLDPSQSSVSPWADISLTKTYQDLVSEILHPSVATVLFCVEEAVLRNAGCKSSTPPRSFADLHRENHVEIAYGDRSAYQAIASACMVEMALNDSDLKTNWEDTALQISLERDMLGSVDIPRCFGAGAIPNRKPHAAWQLGIRDSEIQSFSNANPIDIQQVRVRAALEDALSVLPTKDPTGFHAADRRTVELLPSHVLSQCLREVMALHPDVYRKYLPEEDALLVLCHMSTPQERRQHYVWRAIEHVRTEPRFDRFRTVAKDSALTPRVRAANHACLDDSDGSISKLVYTADTFFPADRSRIFVHCDPTGNRWISGVVDGAVIGLRQGIFFLDVDGTRITSQRSAPGGKKPDGFGSVTLAHTYTSGLVVEHDSAGEVTMRYLAKCRRSLGPGGHEEVRRLIQALGRSTIFWRSGGHRILFPDGATLDYDVDSKIHSYFGVDGGKWEKQEGSEWKRASDTRVRVSIDARTGARISDLENGSLILEYPSGDRAVRHQDGTTMSYCRKSHVLLICAQGFPAVEVDVVVQAQALKHANGEKEAISKGGKQVRLRTLLPDGNEVLVSYDSRVTASVNGEITCVNRDESEVTASDEGSVSYKPAYRGDTDVLSQSNRGSDSSSGVYKFHLDKEELRIDDQSLNEFIISGAHSEVKLSGEVEGVPAKAVMCSPIEPRCFLIFRSGDGLELLSKNACSTFASGVAKNPSVYVRNERSVAVAPEAPEIHETEYVVSHFFTGKNSDFFAGEWSKWEVPDDLDYFMPGYFGFDKVANRVSTWEVRRIRRLQVHPPPLVEREEDILLALKSWKAWRESRISEINRFAVTDPRSEDFLQHEAALRRELRKSYKAAKAARKRAKERQRQQQNEVMRALSVIDESEDKGSLDSPEDDEGDSFQFSDDEDMEADAGPNPLLDECFAAISAFGDGGDVLPRSRVRAALIQILGFGVSEAHIDKVMATTSSTVPSGAPFDVQDLHFLALTFREEVDEARSAAQARPSKASSRSCTEQVDADVSRKLRPGSFWHLEEEVSSNWPTSEKRIGDILHLSKTPIPVTLLVNARKRAALSSGGPEESSDETI